MNFEQLKQSYYHRVAIGPFEFPTYSVIGSDIVLHLPVLEYYASQCKHVTEFGVREGHSTVALLAGAPVLSVDIEHSPIVDLLKTLDLPHKWDFIKSSTLDVTVGETDMLFLDTLHTYDHLSKELARHGHLARKYLAFHDTFTCGDKDLSGPNPNVEGINRAIEEYCQGWKTVYRTKVNNGLWILERV